MLTSANADESMAPGPDGCPSEKHLGRRRFENRSRGGQILVFVAVLLPVLVGFTGLVLDAGFLMAAYRQAQHVADAAAMAAASDLSQGRGQAQAVATATSYVREQNAMDDASVTVNLPPTQGDYAGRSPYVEVVVTRRVQTYLIHVLGNERSQTIIARGVAGYQPSTDGAVIVVLDPDPAPLAIAGLPVSLPPLPALIGGLEVLGLGRLNVNGAVLVNTMWGGVDENGRPAGNGPGPPWGISGTPLLGTSRLLAADIRVAGGVDDPNNYGNINAGEDSPLKANRLAVPDPFELLPVPSLASDPANASAVVHGGVDVVGLPLGPPTILQPGIYDWINIVSGTVQFNPGIYVIRGVNPLTGIALLIEGTITADGVLFYITNSAGFDVATGAPDSGDDTSAPQAPGVLTLVPSVVINLALPGSRISPLNDPASPFDGMTIYQRRTDRRPIVVVPLDLLGAVLGGSSTISGTVYAKWGHVILAGSGTYDARVVAGTARVVCVTDVTLAPNDLLPPAEDVYLVE